jgi:hypothetical protein
MTVWSMLEECVSQLDEPFRRSEIMGWFRRHHPEVNEATLGAHIQAATANATNRAQNNALGARPPLLRRIDHGLYVRVQPPSTAVPELTSARTNSVSADQHVVALPGSADLVLIGCVRTKKAAATRAEELFASPLFERRRNYALVSGLSWFILSAKFGLLAPDDVIGPYDVYLKDQSPGYRKSWGEFVVAQLEQRLPSLHGLTIEVHAGEAYVTPLQIPLAAREAKLLAPLAHRRQGEQLAWYDANGRNDKPAPAVAPLAPQEPRPDVQYLTEYLSDVTLALSPENLFARGRDGLTGPGLYSWWVDEPGAAALTRGLGLPIAAGLIYAGQAGATRRLSGKRSSNTLWGRVAGMHLGRKAEFSTFRRTLAAILRTVIPLSTEDDPQLSVWIDRHLRVVMLSVPAADRLGEQESTVLDALDPPLNLLGRPRTPIRDELTRARATAWK